MGRLSPHEEEMTSANVRSDNRCDCSNCRYLINIAFPQGGLRSPCIAQLASIDTLVYSDAY